MPDLRRGILIAAAIASLGCFVGNAHADAARAREHYQRGTTLFDLTRYREAAAEYEAAYQEKPDAALLFNIAQAYRLAGDDEKSIRFYKTYLHRVPEATNRADVQSRIDELQAALDKQKEAQQGPPEGTLRPQETKASAERLTSPPAAVETTSAAQTTARTPQRNAPIYKKWWLWTIVGLAAGGAAVGLGVGLSRSSGSAFNANLGTFGPTALTALRF